MNMPIIWSTPGTSAGRPETVAPNTTSSRPVIPARDSAQAAERTVFRVTPEPRANDRSRSLVSSPSAMSTTSAVTGCRVGSAGATRVAWSRPDRWARQAARAASPSVPASQRRYSRYGVTGGRISSRPPAPYSANSSSKNSDSDQPSVRMWCCVTHSIQRSSANLSRVTRISGGADRSKRVAASASENSRCASSCAARSSPVRSRTSHGSSHAAGTTCTGPGRPSCQNAERRFGWRRSIASNAERSAAVSTACRSSTKFCIR